MMARASTMLSGTASTWPTAMADVSGNIITLDAQARSAERWQLDTKALAPGIYILNLEKGGRKVTYKVLKE